MRRTAGSGSWDLSRVVAAFAEAAVDPMRWGAAMESAAEATGSFGAALFAVHGRLPRTPYSPSLAASFESYVKDGWIRRDERDRALGTLTRRGVATEFDFISQDEIARHPYYQEFLGRHGLRWFAGVRVASTDDEWCLSIQRSIEQGPFTPEEIDRLGQLSHQLGSAAALARGLGFVRAEAALSAFEVSGSAVVLLDRFGLVLRSNSAAERVLAGDPKIERRRIVSSDRNATAALERALHALLWNESTALMPPIALPRAYQRPVLAYPVRVPAVSADAFAACKAILVLVDLEQRKAPSETVLRAAFELTAAEGRLAARLATGEAMDAVANSLGIAKNTARKQLLSIFEKTGVHRQPELVALVASILGPFIGSG